MNALLMKVFGNVKNHVSALRINANGWLIHEKNFGAVQQC